MSEKVLRPDHYAASGLDADPLDVMEALGIAQGFARGNVLKLVWRMGQKIGEEQSDREKLAFYAFYLAYGREAADEAIRRARGVVAPTAEREKSPQTQSPAPAGDVQPPAAPEGFIPTPEVVQLLGYPVTRDGTKNALQLLRRAKIVPAPRVGRGPGAVYYWDQDVIAELIRARENTPPRQRGAVARWKNAAPAIPGQSLTTHEIDVEAANGRRMEDTMRAGRALGGFDLYKRDDPSARGLFEWGAWRLGIRPDGEGWLPVTRCVRKHNGEWEERAIAYNGMEKGATLDMARATPEGAAPEGWPQKSDTRRMIGCRKLA